MLLAGTVTPFTSHAYFAQERGGKPTMSAVVADYPRRASAFSRTGVANPRIAVAGLIRTAARAAFSAAGDRPHPAAVEAARKEGIDVKGPISGDTGLTARSRRIRLVWRSTTTGHIPTKLIPSTPR